MILLVDQTYARDADLINKGMDAQDVGKVVTEAILGTETDLQALFLHKSIEALRHVHV